MSSVLAVRLTHDPLPTLTADVLLLPVFEQDSLDDVRQLDAATQSDVGQALASKQFRAKLYELFQPVSAQGWATPRVLCVGAGPRDKMTTDRWRRVATAGALAARQRRFGRLTLLARAGASAVDLQAAVEGLNLATFSVDAYRTERDAIDLAALELWTPSPSAEVTDAVTRGQVLGTASNVARALANEPGNQLPPRVFADRATEVLAGSSVKVEVFDERHIEELRMGLLLGVARGSAEPPRFIVMRHEPAGAPDWPVLALIGKGITFDTGGISLKPADGMERMKDDMAGGAAVIAAMRAIAELHAPIKVLGLVPSAENMPGGRAIRPGDVLRSASGKTVEVNNTDAEGRLILGDALWYARELGATHLVDVATLTGACVVALGKVVSGLFGGPDWWTATVRGVAEAAGDRCWLMPTYEEYAEQLRSDIADIVNTGGRPGGAVTAAMFLKEFTGGLPWAHLDVAGTAWAEEAKPYQPRGPVAIAVRTLAQLPFTAGTWPR